MQPNMKRLLKIGLLGAGHLGKIHLRCILQANQAYELAGFYDPNPDTARETAQQFNIRAFPDADALIEAVDVVDIVTPTTTHYALAEKAILAGKHVFIEKPLTRTLEAAEQLIRLSKAQQVQVQVGHVERFNPALLALRGQSLNPMFVEAHRLASFNPRGSDVSVVLDLMIHDLDIVLSMVHSPVKQVDASGVSVVSETPDIANARIAFENGCVANLTASRISLKQMRKVRLFQRDAYISLDFLDKKAQIVRLFQPGDPALPSDAPAISLDTSRGPKWLVMDNPEIEAGNAIQMELETFAQSILEHTRPKVDIEDGYSALKLAYRIIQCIEENNAAVQPVLP